MSFTEVVNYTMADKQRNSEQYNHKSEKLEKIEFNCLDILMRLVDIRNS